MSISLDCSISIDCPPLQIITHEWNLEDTPNTIYQNLGEDKATRDKFGSEFLAMAYSIYSDAHEQIERLQRSALKREMQAKAAKAKAEAEKFEAEAAAMGGESQDAGY